jgi:hypothetical protein
MEKNKLKKEKKKKKNKLKDKKSKKSDAQGKFKSKILNPLNKKNFLKFRIQKIDLGESYKRSW